MAHRDINTISSSNIDFETDQRHKTNTVRTQNVFSNLPDKVRYHQRPVIIRKGLAPKL